MRGKGKSIIEGYSWHLTFLSDEGGKERYPFLTARTIRCMVEDSCTYVIMSLNTTSWTSAIISMTLYQPREPVECYTRACDPSMYMSREALLVPGSLRWPRRNTELRILRTRQGGGVVTSALASLLPFVKLSFALLRLRLQFRHPYPFIRSKVTTELRFTRSAQA